MVSWRDETLCDTYLKMYAWSMEDQACIRTSYRHKFVFRLHSYQRVVYLCSLRTSRFIVYELSANTNTMNNLN